MLSLPIFPKIEDNHIHFDNQTYTLELPLFYMSDFSKMGLLVSDCPQAVSVLQNRFTVIHGLQGAEVLVDGVSGVAGILDALRTAGIDCSVSDVVSHIYQG